MNANNMQAANSLVKGATAGGFIGMVTVGVILATDMSSIGTMFNSADNSLLSSLFLAGAMIKGAVIGAAIGTALPIIKRVSSLRPAKARRQPPKQD